MPPPIFGVEVYLILLQNFGYILYRLTTIFGYILDRSIRQLAQKELEVIELKKKIIELEEELKKK